VRYGRSVPDGFLPVFSVGSEAEAKSLLTVACQTNIDGEFIARELAQDQTIDGLFAFGERLEKMHERMVERGLCECHDSV